MASASPACRDAHSPFTSSSTRWYFLTIFSCAFRCSGFASAAGSGSFLL